MEETAIKLNRTRTISTTLMCVLMFLATACVSVYSHYPPELKGKPSSELVKLIIPAGSPIRLEEVDGKSVHTDGSGVLFLAPGPHKLFLQHFHRSGHVYYKSGAETWNGVNGLSFSGSAGDVYTVVPATGGRLTIEKL